MSAIGVTSSPFKNLTDCPPSAWKDGRTSTININAEYAEATFGLQNGDTIFVLWWAHLADRRVTRHPVHRGAVPVGVFSSRSVHRPNPLGLTVCKVQSLDGASIVVSGLEVLDGTEIIDIKKCVRGDNGELL